MEKISHEDITVAIRDELDEVTMADDLTVRTCWDAVEGIACVVIVR